MSDELLQQEVIKLRRDLNRLTQIVLNLVKAKSATSQSLLEEANKQYKIIQEKQSKLNTINQFKPGDIVEALELSPNKTNGVVKYIACKNAIPSIKKCDKEHCLHEKKPFVWVAWPQGKTFSYHHSKLKGIPKERLAPHIGKELSGKIGPWQFDAKSKMWKKNNDPKEYTEEEFADILYWETHPDDKENGKEFVKKILRITSIEENKT